MAAFESAGYWEKRYAAGGNSGIGSYGRLARFKADVVNSIIGEFGVSSVVDFGCGDGNQLALLNVPAYLGLDPSRTVIAQCRERFHGDETKAFVQEDDFDPASRADLGLSMDVLYHLIEDHRFESYMHRLFLSSRRVVVI